MPQAAAGEVVGGEDAMLERIEGIEIGSFGLAEANRRRGLMGYVGAHVRPIA
jgi:hypothetical protein